MELGCAFMTGLDTPDHIVRAEQFGYTLATVAESPGKCADAWMMLALAAQRTSTIRLAVIVTTPNLHHVVTTATAAATLHALAPGRVELGVGPGSKLSQSFLGEEPASWAEVETYVEGLRALLAGEELEWNVGIAGLRHPPRTRIELPADIPLWVSAHGPQGIRRGARFADRIVTNMENTCHAHLAGDTPIYSMYFGTVLEEGEDASSDRVLAAAGPFAAVYLHRDVIPDTPAGREYRQAVEAMDARRSHLELWPDHLNEVTELERPVITPDEIMDKTGTGTPDQVRDNLERMAQEGIGGVLYGPLGPDMPRELEEFAKVVQSHRQTAPTG